jgi:Mrp family chromosome partitioning ATPase/uncharacterized protein involved in exopolysaccharide biosynthesis
VSETTTLGGTLAPANRVHALQSLKAHRGLAKAVFLLVAAPGLVFAWFHGRPQYVSEATIQISPNFTTTLSTPDELRDQSNRYADFLHQQVLNIVRYEVLERALEQLGPDRSLWQDPGEKDSEAITRLQQRLEVTEVRGSFSITVSLAGSRREGLAEIVNAVCDAYLTTQQMEALPGGKDRVKSLEEYRTEQVANMVRAQEEKAAIARDLGITSFDRTVISPMQAQVDNTAKALGEARRDLILAEARLAGLEAASSRVLDLELLSQARLSMEQNSKSGDPASPLLVRRATLQASLAGLTPDNPAGAVAREQIAEIDETIKASKDGAAAELAEVMGQQRRTKADEERLNAEADVQRDKALIASLEGELRTMQERLGQNNAAFERGRDLEAEMDRTRRRIDAIDDRADMFKLESRSPGFARIDSPARTPEEPSRGGRAKYVIVFLVLAAGLAMGSTVIADAVDRQIHDARDLERAFGFPPLGWIREPHDGDSAQQAEDQVRRLALGIDREAKRKGTRRFVVTSVKPHARTGGLVRDVARELNRTGVKVLTVSADVQDSAASVSPRGLVDLLEGDLDPAAVIEPGPPGMLPLGKANGLSRLPDAHRLGEVLERAGKNYEVVLVHAPPLLLAADGELLVSLSEATLLVVVAEDESLDEVREAVRLLERLSPPVVGMVLTGVRDADGTSDGAA